MYYLIEYSSSYSERTGSLWFCSKDEATNFDADIANNNIPKLLGNTVADGANGIIRNETMAVSLKYLTKFWRSLKKSLINCKIELKIKCTKYWVLSAAGANNDNANSDNIVFTINDTK